MLSFEHFIRVKYLRSNMSVKPAIASRDPELSNELTRLTSEPQLFPNL